MLVRFFVITLLVIVSFRSEAQGDIYLEQHRTVADTVAQHLWEWSELGYREFRSAKFMSDSLAQAGFSVELGVAGMPTAFLAEYGSGEPIIALLAEMDALPGASQAAESREMP